MTLPLKPDDVRERLNAAERRLQSVRQLNGGNFAGAPAQEKHQLVQEYFFHLLGAVEFAAQLVNRVCGVGLAIDEVSLSRVVGANLGDERVKAALDNLYASPRSQPMPSDPYSDEGLVWRAYNYRHQVTHRGRNPLLYRSLNDFLASLMLDPRETPQSGVMPHFSDLTVVDEMAAMMRVFRDRLDTLLEHIAARAA